MPTFDELLNKLKPAEKAWCGIIGPRDYNWTVEKIVEELRLKTGEEVDLPSVEEYLRQMNLPVRHADPMDHSKSPTRLRKSTNRDSTEPALLVKDLLPETILTKVWPTFLQGDYDTAVFKAFKEVEVAVRKAGAFDPTDIGVQLMRKAFDTKVGILSDQTLPETEREAMAHLFAGAIGSIKNPQSHREVAITDPKEAARLILLASHLLQVVNSRTKKE